MAKIKFPCPAESIASPDAVATRVMPSLTTMTTSDTNNESSGKPAGTAAALKEKPGTVSEGAAAAVVKETASPPSEMLTPMGQAIQFAEKKIRNLEKRIVSAKKDDFSYAVNVAPARSTCGGRGEAGAYYLCG